MVTSHVVELDFKMGLSIVSSAGRSTKPHIVVYDPKSRRTCYYILKDRKGFIGFEVEDGDNGILIPDMFLTKYERMRRNR